MRIVSCLPLLLVIAPGVASAQNMNADKFHKRATALAAKGPLALFSRGEIKLLMGEAQRAGQESRAQRLAEVAAGKPARACPPDKAAMGSQEFMQRLGAIPAAERARITMSEAMTRITIARFPCPR